MSDALDESRAHIEHLISTDEIPAQLKPDVTIADLQQLISDLYTESIAEVEIPDSEEEAQEVMREFVEQFALKVGLICLDLNGNQPPQSAVSIPAPVITELFTNLMRHGGTTVQVTVE